MLKHYSLDMIVAGCDESGRGCLAGPVVAAAVILPKSYSNNLINDSKILPSKVRCKLAECIKKESISWSVGLATVNEIDRINILNASFLAMHRAIKKLSVKPNLLLVDGNRFNVYPNLTHKCIVKGDGKYISIAAASIIAKNHRDNIMKNLDFNFHEYDWKNNKGYPTKKHREVLINLGPTVHHRKSFQILPSQLSLDI